MRITTPVSRALGRADVSNKELVIEAVGQLPDGVTLEEISETIALLAALRRGEEAADAGRVVPHEEVRKRLSSWISK
jgi:predicted transcriptional regulator